MSNNPILDELHATRQKLLAEAGGDLHRYVAEARERALASGRTLVEPAQRATWPVPAPLSPTPESISQQPALDPNRQ